MLHSRLLSVPVVSKRHVLNSSLGTSSTGDCSEP